jgi:polyisoprenyl-teichoic acid--peptidoglycan teichoic acid transferase
MPRRLSSYVRPRRLPFMRRPALIPDPGQMIDLQMEDGSWRQGFRGLSAPSTAETGEVLIWVCTEDEYEEARREGRRAVGMRWPAKRMRVSPSPHPWHLRYRRRLVLVAVLVGLFFASGAFAGIVREGGGSGADYPAVKAGEERSTSVAPEEALNVLVLGVDRRSSSTESSTSHSDTMMLVRVSPQTGRIKLLSVPRDLLVEVKPGVEDRINTAYLYGGTQRATAVMENLTGITIDRYAVVDFGGSEDVIDALGGVTLEVGHPIRIGIDGRRVYIPPGRQELDGLEALAYARYRGTACGDLDRIRRQQRLVGALREQGLGWNAITKVPGIVKVMHENVETNLSIEQAISLGRALVGRGKSGGMRSYQLKGKPEILPNGDAVLVSDERANEKILENFRNDGSTKNSRHEQAPRDDGSPSEC